MAGIGLPQTLFSAAVGIVLGDRGDSWHRARKRKPDKLGNFLGRYEPVAFYGCCCPCVWWVSLILVSEGVVQNLKPYYDRRN